MLSKRVLLAAAGVSASAALAYAIGRRFFLWTARGRFEAEQIIPLDIGSTFDFFADAHNLEVITPPFLKFRVTTPKPITMRPGAIIDYNLRIRGFPTRWRSEINSMGPSPQKFVDVQTHGPYRTWVHTHTFESVGDNATLVRDEVDYSVPGGTLVERFLVRPDIERIFAFRRRFLDQWARGKASSRPGADASDSGGEGAVIAPV